MVAPFVNMSVKGFVWYVLESKMAASKLSLLGEIFLKSNSKNFFNRKIAHLRFFSINNIVDQN